MSDNSTTGVDIADPKFPITEAQLTGNFCETLTYGIYLTTCTFCVRTLLMNQYGQWRKPHEIRWYLVIVAVILFGVSTFDVIIGLIHNIKAFVDYHGEGGAPQELTNIRDWINVSRSVAQAVNMVIGDMVLIFRCYIVYARRWKVIVPSVILYLGGVAMAIKLIVVEGSTGQKAITLNSGQIRPWWSAFFAITMVQNTLTTSLLVYRIWKVEKQNERCRSTRNTNMNSVNTYNSQPRLRQVIRVIAESGLAYTTLVFLTFVVSVCNSNALYPLSDATLQATGITFNVIIVRSSPRREQEFTVFETNEKAMAEQGASSSDIYPMKSSHIQFAPKSTNQSTTLDLKSQIGTTVVSQDESFNEQETDGIQVKQETFEARDD